MSSVLQKKSLRELLDAARKDLLDFSLRNNLLNFRPSKTRTIEVVDGDPGSIFRYLVPEEKALHFLPEIENGGNSPNARRSETALQTRLVDKFLQSRLLATYYAHKTHIEERGVNILFLAIGILHWYEDDASDKELRAPVILIPTILERSSAREKFTLKYSGEDLEENLSLSAKLRADFGIKYPELPEIEDFDVDEYLGKVTKAIHGQARWSLVSNEIALSFFSFGKFLMYRDLDSETWPKDRKPTDHGLLRSILLDGFHEPPSSLPEDVHLDQLVPVGKSRQVVDADSSQVLAILDVSVGRNLVIQGPPGTGKSQTITNLIAQGIVDDKKILFIAEKLAALEVVKRRLNSIGLGDTCLELHSHSAHKKTVLAELRRTLELGKPATEDARDLIAQYSGLRDRLNGYCEAVNTPISKSGITPNQAMGRLAKLRYTMQGVDLPQAAELRPSATDIEALLLWSRADFERRETVVANLQSHLAVMGLPDKHPLRGSRLKIAFDSDIAGIRSALIEATRTTSLLRQTTEQLSSFMGLQVRLIRRESELICKGAHRSLRAPHIKGIELRTNEWQAKRDELTDLITAGRKYAHLHAQYDSILISEAWDQDVLEVRQNLQVYGAKWWRFLSKNFRQTRNRLAGLCRQNLPKTNDARLQLVDAIMEAARAKSVIVEKNNLAARLYGVQWQGEKSNWDVLAKLQEWVIDLYRDLGDGKLPQGLIDFLAGNPNLDGLEQKIQQVEAALPVHLTNWQRVLELLDFNETIRVRAIEEVEYTRQEQALKNFSDNLHLLPDQLLFNNLSGALLAEGLDWLVAAARTWPEGGRHLTSYFHFVWYEILLRKAFKERSNLKEFTGLAHEKAVSEFRKFDELFLKQNRAEILLKHWTNLPSLSRNGQLGILTREFEKRSRHLPIRQLISKTGNAIQQIKPVFMMSPLSIAAYLPPDSIRFDLVIFDEASQVPPVDAFGAVLRGGQVAVVGDSKQLPPTSFFENLSGNDEDQDEDELVTTDIESILGLLCGQGAPQRMLRWHYRSQHESLIAVSNKEFYDNRLVIFPSPQFERKDIGLIFRQLANTFYERGTTRTNPLEAAAVADAVIDHARNYPNLTLGVAAFSIAQMQAILDQIELRRKGNPAYESFFAAHPHEPFFVKNLETVQGDERDVIFVSVGYGRDKDGYIAYNFGALNREGGERRLNVLITRARRRCEVFTNLGHEDIDLHRAQGRGVAALKVFLKYAQTRILDVPVISGRPADSEFEEAVADALRRNGLEVDAQVGSAGFFLDLAVRDTEHAGRYLLGIECDGATYHQSRSARDRDRLRQQVLEALDWRLHRIWSTDWFAHPDRELKKVLAAIEQAKAYRSQTGNSAAQLEVRQTESKTENEITRGEPKGVKDSTTLGEPYAFSNPRVQLNGRDLHVIQTSKLAEWITDVVQIESPVHKEEVFRRITQAAGLSRIGNRIVTALSRGVDSAVRSQVIRRKGAFLWYGNNTDLSVRDRSDFPPQLKKLELISSEEIGAAIKLAVKRACGIQAQNVPVAACNLLGFGRVTDDMRLQVNNVMEELLKSEHLSKSGDFILPAE